MPSRSIRLTVLMFFAFTSAASAVDDPWRQINAEYRSALSANQYSRGDSIARKMLEFAQEHPLPHEEDNVARVAHSLNCIADSLAGQGKYDKARLYLTRSLNLNIELRGPTSKHLIPILARLADLSRQLGQIDEAADYLRRAMEVKEVALTWQKKDEAFVELASLLNDQCAVFIEQQKYALAQKVSQRTLDIQIVLPEVERQKTATNLVRLGSHFASRGDDAQAVPCFEQARDIYGQIAIADQTRLSSCLKNLAALYRQAGREQDAEKVEAQLERVQAADS